MALTARPLRLVTTLGVTSLGVINAVAFWGEEVARRGDAILQVATAGAAVVCGLVVAWRVSGLARWWRLMSAGTLLAWVLGQVLWLASGGQEAPLPARVAYLVVPVLAMGALVLLLRLGGGVRSLRDSPLQHPLVANLLDGVVAGLSFLLLSLLGRFGTASIAALPRSDPALAVIFAVTQVAVVAVFVVAIMLYQPGRPYRPNFLMLASGLLLMASSDRLVAYFRSVSKEELELWAGIGLIVGPVLIVFAMLEHPQVERTDVVDQVRGLDWVQLILPYLGFVGITVLLAYHVLIKQPVSVWVSVIVNTIVVLLAVRAVLAAWAQNQLTHRLYWAQQRLAYQVHHDALTGLPNRLLFSQRLDEAMRDGEFVLIFVDIDDFKEVNDRFGHAAGDELLCAVGDRLKRCVGEGDTLARIGGDEFAILTGGQSGTPEVVADRLRVVLRDPFPLHGSSLRVRASMGLVGSGAGSPAQTSDDLLRQADVSMYAGKRMGKDTAVVYHPAAGVRVDFPTALRHAHGDVPAGFTLVYQPVVRLPDNTPVALEALARWSAPNGIQIPPETFVGTAEAAGLGADLDELVLRLACRDVAEAALDVDIHVNIGAARLGNLGFEEHVRRTLEQYRIAPTRLVLEITETLPILDLADAAAQIERLNAVGVRVALDDFGAGYNSLTYLHALPVQIVKLDRSLAVETKPEKDRTLYRSVVGLCAELGFDVVAEGIESAAQVETVVAAGCRFAQGHLFGRPAPIADVVAQYGDLLRRIRVRD